MIRHIWWPRQQQSRRDEERVAKTWVTPAPPPTKAGVKTLSQEEWEQEWAENDAALRLNMRRAWRRRWARRLAIAAAVAAIAAALFFALP